MKNSPFEKLNSFVFIRVMGPISTQMRSIMKVNGTETIEVAGEECITKTEQYTRASGTMTNVMDKEC
jgi:hypothetical protein